MQEVRRQRLQGVILEELSMLARTLKDPRIPPLTFTSCEVTPDAEQATVYVLILGGSKAEFEGEDIPALSDEGARLRMKDCLDGLASASGFMRRHLAKILSIRHIPQLVFREDKGLDNSLKVHALLKKISELPKTDTQDE